MKLLIMYQLSHTRITLTIQYKQQTKDAVISVFSNYQQMQ